jgi:Holliday junction resolvase RusA-like endonuclease
MANTTYDLRNKKITLSLTPQTHVRATKGDSIFFKIPRDKLRPSGLKRLLRLERYNEYKINLLAEAKRKQFLFPEQGASVTFFIPCPRSWSKKKKKLYHFRLHQSKPDIDNLAKALLDSLLFEDKHIAHIELFKRWVDFPMGWIDIETKEIHETLPFLAIPPEVQRQYASS